jgi:hypothetical protein
VKKCPFCAEEIQDEAIVCRYCKRDLPKPAKPKNDGAVVWGEGFLTKPAPQPDSVTPPKPAWHERKTALVGFAVITLVSIGFVVAAVTVFMKACDEDNERKGGDLGRSCATKAGNYEGASDVSISRAESDGDGKRVTGTVMIRGKRRNWNCTSPDGTPDKANLRLDD